MLSLTLPFITSKSKRQTGRSFYRISIDRIPFLHTVSANVFKLNLPRHVSIPLPISERQFPI